MSITAYYDTAGTESGRGDLLATAGIVGSDEQWLEFDAEWRAVLKRFAVPALHMRRFAHSKEDFASWKGDEPKRSAFISELLQVLIPSAANCFVVLLRTDHFDEADRHFSLRQEYAAGPYVFTTQTCVAYADQWMSDNCPDDSRRHVVEHGDNKQGPLRVMAEKHPQFNIEVRKKSEVGVPYPLSPMQAADLIAFEHRNNPPVGCGGSDGPAQGRFKMLKASLQTDVHCRDVFQLCWMCEQRPDLFPPKRV